MLFMASRWTELFRALRRGKTRNGMFFREAMKSTALDEDDLVMIAHRYQIPLAPRLAVIEDEGLPVSIDETYDWLGHYLPRTRVALDDGAKAHAEGIVLRTPDRSITCKARFADYERTLGINTKKG